VNIETTKYHISSITSKFRWGSPPEFTHTPGNPDRYHNDIHHSALPKKLIYITFSVDSKNYLCKRPEGVKINFPTSIFTS
jgi:hypothetical protein